MKKNIKLGIVTSKGGHFTEIARLETFYNTFDHFFITFEGSDTCNLLKQDKVYYAYYPESRNIINLIRNFFLAIFILFREKPSHLISAGAGIAIPFFLVGKYFFNIKTIYIESYDSISKPSLTGKVIYKFTDLFLIQHACQKKWYPNGKYWGKLL